MKSYLMTGIAALTLCAGFTSCSHDDFEPMTQAEIDKANYDMAFLKYVGGKIDKNQDWGFGSSTTKGLTRAIQPSFNFPSDADASKFLDDIPEGVVYYGDINGGNGYANGISYIDENIEKFKAWGAYDSSIPPSGGNTGGTLYIKGYCDFTVSSSKETFYFAGNGEIYLVKGATLKLNVEDAANLQTNTMIYIAEGAKLIAEGELKLNNGLHIYNHGTIEAPQLSTNSNSVLYNVGTVTVENKISVENDLSVVVNDGVITATDLNTAGSGKFLNNNDVTISGNTTINSNSNAWVNNGDYKTGYFTYTAGSDDVINNCRLTVKEDFNMNLGDNSGNGNFKMDAGSGVVTKNFNGGGIFDDFTGGPFYIYMGANSVFKVTGTATMNATKADYGIYGPETGDYAVFQAGEIVAGKAGQGYEVTYGGNLAVVTESHFANGYSGTYPYIDIKGNATIYTDGEMPEITIEATACNPGFTGKKGTVEPTPTPTPTPSTEEYDLRIIAEDLSASSNTDFDFNDVVIDVKFDAVDAKIAIVAAGGTLPLRIDGRDDWEVHDLFKVDTDCMVNTNASAKGLKGEDKPAVVLQLGRGIKDAGEAKGIKIEVFKNGTWQELKAEKGEPAAKLAVGVDYKILDELTSIAEEYEFFLDWVNNNNFTSKWW